LKPADFSPNEAGSISGMIGILEGKIENEGFKSQNARSDQQTTGTLK
jgi:hypothetical protein